MTYKVQIQEQVRAFQAIRGMDDRHALKRAILGLAHERGDIKALGENLSGYYRLKVGLHRIVFRYLPGAVIDCVYVNERKLVYELFETELHRLLGDA